MAQDAVRLVPLSLPDHLWTSRSPDRTDSSASQHLLMGSAAWINRHSETGHYPINMPELWLHTWTERKMADEDAALAVVVLPGQSLNASQ